MVIIPGWEYMDIKKLIMDLKQDNWYLKSRAINTLGNISYEDYKDALYVAKHLVLELDYPKPIVIIRILWAINNILKIYPDIIFDVLPGLIKLTTCGNDAIEDAANNILNKPNLKSVISKYPIILSKRLYSNNYFKRIHAMCSVWNYPPLKPDLVIPEIMDLCTEKVRMDDIIGGFFSRTIIECDDHETMEEICNIIKNVSCNLIDEIEYSPKHIRDLLSHPSDILKLTGFVLISRNSHKIDNKTIEELLKLLYMPKLNRPVKAGLLFTLCSLSENHPFLKSILSNYVKKTLHSEEDWLLIFSSLAVLYMIGETINDTSFLDYECPLVSSLGVLLLKNDLEKGLKLLNDGHLSTYLATIERFVKDDVPDSLKVKFLNELQNPWNYIYNKVDNEFLELEEARIENIVEKLMNNDEEELWISEINNIVSLGYAIAENPQYANETIDVIKKSLENPFGLIRAQGLWLLRLILETSENPLYILSKLGDHINPYIVLNDSDMFVRLNFIMVLRKMIQILKNTEDSKKEIDEIVGILAYEALNDEKKIVSKVSELILKYDLNVELDKKEISIENINKYANKYPEALPAILKYLARKNKGNTDVLRKIIEKTSEYSDHSDSCNVLCILDEIGTFNEELRRPIDIALSKVPNKCMTFKVIIIRGYLDEYNWKIRLKGLTHIENISKLNVNLIDVYTLDLMKIALFDPMFQLREKALELLKKIDYPCPEIDKEKCKMLAFSSEDKIIGLLKHDFEGTFEALYELSTRDIENIDNVMIIISKFKDSEFWFIRAYAYKILQNIIDKSKTEKYHYEIVNWCLTNNEENPLISEMIEDILNRLNSSARIDVSKTVSEKIRKIEILLEDSDWVVRVETLKSLGDFIDEGHFEYLNYVIRKLDDPHWRVKNAALGILSKIDPELVTYAIPKIIKLLKDGDESVVLKALLTLKKYGQKDSKILERILPILEEMENYTTWSIKEEILRIRLLYFNKIRHRI